MKKILIAIFTLCAVCISTLTAQTKLQRVYPDEALLFSYATTKDHNHNGLHFAWSNDGITWNTIGPEHSFIRSDYSRWGTEKRMLAPYVEQDENGVWHCIWRLNETLPATAYASTENPALWGRQSYILDKDLASYPQIVKLAEAQKNASLQSVSVNGQPQNGQIHKVKWPVIETVINAQKLAAYTGRLHSELAIDDATRFAGLKPLTAKIIVSDKSKPISDLMIGIFFEDINYSADGGLYAELIQNRDFEYSKADRDEWDSKKAWNISDDGSFSIDTINPIHPNNPHYAVVSGNNAILTNEGWNGIVVRQGEKYDVSLFSKLLDGKSGAVTIRLKDKEGNNLGETMLKAPSSKWQQSKAVITAKGSASDATLEVVVKPSGKVALDMISLFPQNTFKGRKNGLRTDLAQTLSDMKPRFVRFPGGCVAHGDGIENMYYWKNSIGKLEERKPMRNIWGYHQTLGLGYLEYFQFCEDIGAEALPVLAAGIPCQNSGHNHTTGLGGQQGGIPMCDMDEYVQDILDLIEYANGDAKTTLWGKKRAESGHPEPFNLKYIGIGNEDLITDLFEERFVMINNAIKAKYPQMQVIGTVGPSWEGTDYVEGWDLATRHKVDMVDEHYYQPPAWFIYNQDYYDKYDREKSKIYLGEYAAHVPGRHNNIETAISEALYLTAVERNGDVVTMTSYAPLLAKEGSTQWNPDLIYFNNSEVKPTVGYHVQKLYGQNNGNEYVFSDMSLSDNRDGVRKRVAQSVVRDEVTGDYIIKLVNMLPQEVNSSIDLGGIKPSSEQAVRTTLSGKPDDRTAKPVTDTINIGDEFEYTLPPYSFTVIRIKSK